MAFRNRDDAKIYQPQDGDTLKSIAERETAAGNLITWQELAQYNWGTQDDNEIEAARRNREHPQAPRAIYVRTVAEWLAVAEYVIGKPLPADGDESDQPMTLLDAMQELAPAVEQWKKEQAAHAGAEP